MNASPPTSVGRGERHCLHHLMVTRLKRPARSRPLPREYVSLGGDVAVDVLVEPAGPRAGVGGEASVGILGAALVDVGGVVVGVASLARAATGEDVAPVAAGSVCE